MGCHTWFYRKIDVSIDEARTNVISHRNESIEQFEDEIKKIKNPNHITKYGISKEDATHVIEVFKRQVRMIKKGLCNCAVFNKFDRGRITVYIKGVGLYEEVDDFFDIFRVGGYPDDKLFTFDDTIDYISKKENGCYLDKPFDKVVSDLKRFWTKYPNGMIEFG